MECVFSVRPPRWLKTLVPSRQLLQNPASVECLVGGSEVIQLVRTDLFQENVVKIIVADWTSPKGQGGSCRRCRQGKAKGERLKEQAWGSTTTSVPKPEPGPSLLSLVAPYSFFAMRSGGPAPNGATASMRCIIGRPRPGCSLRKAILGELVIWELAVILVVALIGQSLSGVAGFGAGVIVLPVLVWFYGPVVAVPVVAIFQIMGTVARIWLSRQGMNWKLVGWFAAGSLPFALFGSFLFISADTVLLTRIMGGGMIALVALTQLPWAKRVRMTLWGFPPLGASAGFLASVMGIPGPFAPVFFLAYGMRPQEYMATFSLSMFLIQLPKVAVYGAGDLLTPLVAGLGIGLGLVGIWGAYFGAKILRRVPDRVYTVGINIMVVAFGVLFLVTGG